MNPREQIRFNGYPISANVSLLFTERPFLDRFRAAADAGFDRVEVWWPFSTPTPTADDLASLVGAIRDADVSLTGLNFWAGDMAAGDRGVASIPDRSDELVRNIPSVLSIAEQTGCRSFNLLYGKGAATSATRRAAARAIGAAADAVDAIGGTVLIEPLAASLNSGYILHTVDDAITLIDGELDSRPHVKVLFDTFHLGMNGVDIVEEFRAHHDRVGHVQFADAPGRGEPGTGGLPFDLFMTSVREVGYVGSIAAEYVPTGDTLESLGWADAATPDRGQTASTAREER